MATTGGRIWFRQSSPIFNAFTTDSKDTNLAWAGGSGIIHTTDGGGPPVGIIPITNEIPYDYKLCQNYPNPFNPSTNIKYQISKSGHVKLVVYDMQGKQLAELVNQKQIAGTYETDWDATGYSTGVYFYSLIIDGKIIDTKKMILIK